MQTTVYHTYSRNIDDQQVHKGVGAQKKKVEQKIHTIIQPDRLETFRATWCVTGLHIKYPERSVVGPQTGGGSQNSRTEKVKVTEPI